MVYFTDLFQKPKQRVNIGWSLIFVLCSAIFIKLVLLTKETLSPLTTSLRMKYKKQ